MSEVKRGQKPLRYEIIPLWKQTGKCEKILDKDGKKLTEES